MKNNVEINNTEDHKRNIELILEKIKLRDVNEGYSSLDDKEKKILMSYLRNIARESYIDNRVIKKRDFFKRVIETEENLFSSLPLSKRENISNEIDKTLINIAEELLEIKPDLYSYQIPEDLENIKTVEYSAFLDRYNQHNDTNDENKWSEIQYHHNKLANKQIEEEFNPDDLVYLPSQNFNLEKYQDSKIKVVKTEFQNNKHIQFDKSFILNERKNLPIFKHKELLIKTIIDNSVTIIVGETGSGKTTQLPQYLFENKFYKNGKIVITQPRRVAAMSVASRVSYERQCKLGTEVGYQVRFENMTSELSKLIFMTDGMLLNEFIQKPDLNDISVVILDEAHERTIHTDILLGLLKDLCTVRKDFKLVIASATLDSGKFSNYFENSPVLEIPGRKYPVEIFYSKNPEPDYIEAVILTVLQIHISQSTGDILVFLTGQEEIENIKEQLIIRLKNLSIKTKELIILPLYSSLPSDLQAKIFFKTPENARKVILSTNIAETSLTIPSIVYVVDCGLAKRTSFNSKTGISTLCVSSISKASADQRAGRAGRVCPGKCFRLYTRWSFENELEEIAIPEIQRSNLSSIVLLLKSIGVENLIKFDFLDSPHPQSLVYAFNSLLSLGAIDRNNILTEIGKKMSEFPLEPEFSRTLIASEEYNVLKETIKIIGLLTSGQSIFLRNKLKNMEAEKSKKEFERSDGDLTTLLYVYNKWETSGYSEIYAKDNFLNIKCLIKGRNISEQLVKICKNAGLDTNGDRKMNEESINVGIRKSFLSGFFNNAVRNVGNGVYKMLKKNLSLYIHPSSAMIKRNADILIFTELVHTSKEFIRNVFAVDKSLLLEMCSFYYNINDINGLEKLKYNKMHASD